MQRRQRIILVLLVTAGVAGGWAMRVGYERHRASTPMTKAELLGIDPHEFDAWHPTKHVSIVADGVPLKTVIEGLAVQLGEPIRIDWERLVVHYAEPDDLVFMHRKERPAHEMMAAIERAITHPDSGIAARFDRVGPEHGDGWVLNAGDSAQWKTSVREYDLRWFVWPLYERWVATQASYEADDQGVLDWIGELLGMSGGGYSGQSLFFEDSDPAWDIDEAVAELLHIIRDTHETDHWYAQGGTGASLSTMNGIMTANAPARTHRHIADLLYRIYLADRFGIDDTDRAASEDNERMRFARRLRTPIDSSPDAKRSDRYDRSLLDATGLRIEYIADDRLDYVFGYRTYDPSDGPITHGDILSETFSAAIDKDVTRDEVASAIDGTGNVALTALWHPRKAPAIVRVYAIGDLATPATEEGVSLDPINDAERIGRVVDTLRDSIDPDNWASAGGLRTSASYFGNALIVRTDLEIHGAIAERLDSMRRVRFRAQAPTEP